MGILNKFHDNAVEKVLSEIDLPFKLHDYQIEDAQAACTASSYGLYEEMGLGKTTIATVAGVYKLLTSYDSVITLCPASLVVQWVEWLESLNLVVCKYSGPPGERLSLNLDADFIVMSFNIFQRDYRRIVKEVKDPFFIVDEGTILCNHDNLLYKMLCGGMRTERVKQQVGRAFIEVPKKIMYEKVQDGMLILTGTPINKPTDAYGLINITSPWRYTNYNQFKRKHILSEDEYGQPREYKDLEGIYDALTENGVIREVGDHLDLPEKIYKVIKYDLSPDHKKMYNRLVDEQLIVLDDGELVDLTTAGKLYHACQQFIFTPFNIESEPAGFDVLDHIVAETERRLMFANYIETNLAIMKRYKAGGCFGRVSNKKQEAFIEAFKNGTLKTVTAHPKSGGVGLNFQIANQVVFPELPITPRDFAQAEARCWRQGQKNPVVITVLLARGTIQTSLYRKFMEKSDVAEETLKSKRSIREELLGGEINS